MAITKIIWTGTAYEVIMDGKTIFVPNQPGNRIFGLVQEAINAGMIVEDPTSTPDPVPGEITKVQLFDALSHPTIDLWTTFQPLLEANPRWQYITKIPRQNPTLVAGVINYFLATGVTNEAATAAANTLLDQVFALGSTLNA